MTGGSIADDGAVFGGSGYHDANSECLNWFQAAWFRDGSVTHFPSLFGMPTCYISSGFARANPSGTRVAGSSTRPWNPPWAPEYTQELPFATLWIEGVPTLLHPSGATASGATAVNDAGVIVGYASYLTGSGLYRHGGKWDQSGGFSSLGQQTFPKAVNLHGEVVGQSEEESLFGLYQAVLWLPAAAYGLSPGMHKLPNLPGPGIIRALDINDQGVVVGFHQGGGGFASSRGWLWTHGQSFDLNDLIAPDSLYHIYRAYAVNASGQIACEAILNNDPLDYVYVLLTPEG
jgi:uncharacterized membrane protein